MRREHLQLLLCPSCRNNLAIADIQSEWDNRIETGHLVCHSCAQTYPIHRFIPRFVPSDNYASGFGFEWTKHARTQYDSHSGTTISGTRFFAETRWPRSLPGDVILEVGSGSGRFTEHAASTGATVVSLDYSYAVEANYASNGHKPNVLIVQGDIYHLPVRENSFDKVLCIGVLQHTPDVEKSFKTLPRYLKPGGNLVVDVYRKRTGFQGLLMTKYWVRPFTKRFAHPHLYRLCQKYIHLMWPISEIVHSIPKIGRQLNGLLLIPDYRDLDSLSDEQLKEWAILDLFDVLSPEYDQPQTLETLRTWFHEAELKNFEVNYGYNGIEGRGNKP